MAPARGAGSVSDVSDGARPLFSSPFFAINALLSLKA